MKPVKIAGWALFLFVVCLGTGCKSLTQGQAPEEKFKQTDYLNEFAGVYETRRPGGNGMGQMVTLRLYPDGTCLLAEKELGSPPKAVQIRYGRWDHSDFPTQIDLHLSTAGGARNILSFDPEENRLVHSGTGWGPEGVTLIRR